MKKIIINLFLMLIGLISLSGGIAYLFWFINMLNKNNVPQTFINVFLVTLAVLFPFIIFGIGGTFLFIISIDNLTD